MKPSQAIEARRIALPLGMDRRVADALSVLRRNPNLAFGLIILVAAGAIAIFAPLIDRLDPLKLSPLDRLLAPSGQHWFGTDEVGRDVYSRTIHGARLSLSVAFSVVVVDSICGFALGLIAGYSRRIDNILMRFMDGLMAIPSLLLALALIALLGSSVQNIIIALSVVGIPRMVRVVRSSVLSLREQTFVEAARALGTPSWRILTVHIAPNNLAPVTVQSSFVFASAILTEASLSFIGAGTQPYIPSWGNIISQGRNYLQIAYWIIVFPGVFLALTVLAANLVGDGIRDVVDPKLRRRL